MKEGKILLKFLNQFLTIFVVFYFLIFLDNAHAAVPQILSFQGRLTDASGNLLGGNGTNYYFKFDIFPSLTGGSSLWSSGATAITIKVTQGVFNTLLGDTSAGYSALNLNFDSPDYYLKVQVDDNSDFSSSETLSPRQRIAASGFAINAETVHGGRFLNATGVGQFGGLATAAYSRFGTDTTSHAGTIDASNDLLISGGLEVNGSAAFDGFVIFGNNASVSGNLELTGSGSKFGINAGLVMDTAFEVGGAASISGTLTLAGGLTSNYTASNSFSGSLDITKGLHVSGGSTVANTLGIIKAISSAQLNIRNNTVNAGFYVDSAGDLTLSTTGENVRANDQNLWVCIGACGATDPLENGNVIVETGIIFDNNLKFKQVVDGVTASKSVIMYDSGNNSAFEFDEERQ